jgi:hypothetical protein
MKILNLVLFLAFVSLVSCTKKEDVSLIKSDNGSFGKLQSELIIGNWQLTAVGTMTQSSQSSSSGCGGGSSQSTSIAWRSASVKENLSFGSSGEFSKSAASDAACSGTYKVSNGAVFTKTGCSVDEQKQVINDVNTSVFIVEGDNNELFKYQKQ